MNTVQSFDRLVTFDHEDHGFSDDDVVSFFPEPVSTAFKIQSWPQEDAMYRIIMSQVFYTRYEDLLGKPSSKAKATATAQVEVFEDDDLEFPDIRVICVPREVTPQFEF